MAAELSHDLGGQVSSRLGLPGLGRDVVAVQSELIAQPGGRAAGPGRSQLPQAGQQLADLTAGQQPGEGADHAGGFQVGQPGDEHFDVASRHSRQSANTWPGSEDARSEERRGGKEGRYRWAPDY